MANNSVKPGGSICVGKIVSFICFISLLTIVPDFLKLFWPYVVDLPDPLLYIVVILVTNVLVFGTYYLIMWYIYMAKIPFFEQFRSTNRPWPWETDPKKWRTLLFKSIWTSLLGIFIFNSMIPLVQYLIQGLSYDKSIEDWPTTFTLFWQILLYFLVEDTLFYWAHSTLHHPKLYWLHKKHHQYNIAVITSTTYVHPLQYFVNSAPAGLGFTVLVKFIPVHYVTIVCWMILRLLAGCEDHSGYNWTWAQLSFLPGRVKPEYHDFHHSHNSGNYASMFYFWDTIMGTNQFYRNYQKAKEK